jgi:hypothetical protein
MISVHKEGISNQEALSRLWGAHVTQVLRGDSSSAGIVEIQVARTDTWACEPSGPW